MARLQIVLERDVAEQTAGGEAERVEHPVQLSHLLDADPAETYDLTQPTAGRKLAALERSLGMRLFDRTPTGLQITAEGSTLLEAATAMEERAREFALRAEVTIDDATMAQACLVRARDVEAATGEHCWREVLDRVAGRVSAAR